jgi:hypothetical protein
MKFNKFVFVIASISILGGCSGGGGGGGGSTTTTTASTTTFPYAAAAVAQRAIGWNKNFTATVTGSTSCSGSGSISVSPATTATTFALTPTNTVPALSGTQTVTLIWTNCNPTNNASSSTFYVNPSTYASYGSVNVGTFYNVNLTPPTLPTTVKIGDTGILGTINQYTDSTETVSNGIDQGSYMVSADTATTAIITIIDTYTGSTDNGTALARYRISISGTLTPISFTESWTSGTANGLTRTLTIN